MSLLKSVPTGSETHPASYSIGNEALSPEREGNQEFPSTSEVMDV